MSGDEFDAEEEPTGRSSQYSRSLDLNQWRELVHAFESLPTSAERERLLVFVSRWPRLGANERAILCALAPYLERG